MEGPTRRDILRATPVALGALAGCEAFESDTQERPGDDPETTTTTVDGQEHELELRNESDVERFVSVAVLDGEVVRSSSTVELPAETKRTLSLRAPDGILTVELETTDGLTATHPWAVGDDMDRLHVTLTASGVSFSQRAWCTPACSPVSLGGTGEEFPYFGGPPFMAYYSANVVLVNTTTDTVVAHLEIQHDGEQILDYEYRLPPGLTVELPGVHSGGAYTVTVETPMGATSHDWRPPKERRLQMRLTESGVHATCGQSTQSLLLENRANTPHRIEVTAYRPESDLAEFRQVYILPPGSNTRDTAVYTGSGQYVLRVEASTGETTTYDWWLCPPRGPTKITVTREGKLRVLQFQPGE